MQQTQTKCDDGFKNTADVSGDAVNAYWLLITGALIYRITCTSAVVSDHDSLQSASVGLRPRKARCQLTAGTRHIPRLVPGEG